MDKSRAYGLSRMLLGVLWLGIGAAFLVPLDGLVGGILRGTGGLLAVAHLMEYVLFRQRIRALPEGPVVAFVMNFFFGLFYWSRPDPGGDEL